MPPTLSTRIVFAGTGGLLLFAGCAKLHGIWMNEFWREVAAIPPQLIPLLIAMEIIVGVWLLVAAFGSAPFAKRAWAVGVALYGVLTLGAISLSVLGVARCDCMGVIEFSPVAMIVLDGVCLFLLVLARPRLAADSLPGSASWPLFKTEFAGTLAGLALVMGAASFVFGDPVLYARLVDRRPHVIALEASEIDCGEVAVDSLREVTIKVVNHSASEARIVGGGTSCRCLTLEAIPATIPAHASLILHVRIKVPSQPGQFSQVFS